MVRVEIKSKIPDKLSKPITGIEPICKADIHTVEPYLLGHLGNEIKITIPMLYSVLIPCCPGLRVVISLSSIIAVCGLMGRRALNISYFEMTILPLTWICLLILHGLGFSSRCKEFVSDCSSLQHSLAK